MDKGAEFQAYVASCLDSLYNYASLLARPTSGLLSALEVFYDREPISRFVLTAALSDNPLITFKVRARPGATLRVTLTNTRGERFGATHAIPVA